MNLSIVLTDFINLEGILKTYRFIPINPYNRIVVDRISDICMDVKDNSDKDIGLLRIYDSNKCQLMSTTCKLKNFNISNAKEISFCFEHMYIPVESSRTGSCGIYNFILPISYKLTELHIVDPFDKREKKVEDKKHFRYNIYCDQSVNLQSVQMELRSGRGSFSFLLMGKATNKNSNILDFEERDIRFDDDIRNFTFDEGIKKSFWENLKDSLLLEPNFDGIGIDLKKLFRR